MHKRMNLEHGISVVKGSGISSNYRKVLHRYNRPIPSDRVQMDVCKIADRLNQYTAKAYFIQIMILFLMAYKTSPTLDFIWNLSKSDSR